MATMTLPRVQTYRIYYNTGAAEEAGADGAVYCGAKKKHMAQWQYDMTALQTERAGRDIIITRATVSWQTSSTSTYDIRVQDARCYGRGAGVYLGDAKGTSTSSMQWISTSRAAPHDSITLIQNTINSGATAIYASCQNESTSSNVYGTCQYGTLTIEYDYATPLTVIEYLVADKTMIALGESVGVSASIRNITESEISAVQLQVVREVDGADVAIGDAVTVDVTIPAAETAQINQTLTIPAWANAARATQLYVLVTIAGKDAEKAALCTALDKRYNPTIETFSVSRATQHPIDGWIKSDNGANTMTDLKIDLGSGASGFTLKVYYGTGEIDTSTAQRIDLTSRISDAIAGLTNVTAKNIVTYREENGAFTTRKQLLKVPKLGPKAFEQCAGFLRVPESKSVLDNTGVHPESYAAAEGLLALCGYTLADVAAGRLADLPQKVKALGWEETAARLNVGVPTLQDVAAELAKPGRDVRDELPAPILRTDVLEIKDLAPGMVLTGTVRNVVDFGVFVDIGVHQDGLVHISQVCNKFIRHPSEVVSVGDVVKVTVLEVDEKKHRISLSMKQAPKQ